ncbi:MAG: 3'(2'),5'-bisphosphate nucleotidase CysQ [Pseudomonadota bacterium]
MSDLDLLIDACHAAGDIALGFWRQNAKTWEKNPGDPVTEADLAVDAMLKEKLLAARPDYGWLSEETPDNPARLGQERVFIIDPIDGTRAFIDGKPSWAHSIAVAEKGVVRAAAVFLPARELLYVAAAGEGATLNGAAISVTGRDGAPGARILANGASFTERYWRIPTADMTRSFRPSLAYRLALVADGQADGMVTFRNTWEWDIAAGALIATEAGATVTDRTGAPIRFNSEGGYSQGILTATPAVHLDLLDRLAPAA